MTNIESSVLPIQSDGRIVGARLCHFGNGSAGLLSAHKDWITNHFAPKLRQHPYGWIDLLGHASPTGNAENNLALSKYRIDSVEFYLKAACPGVNVNVKKPYGTSDAASFGIKSDSGGYWRAVEIYWFGVNEPVLIPVYKLDTVEWLKRVYNLIPSVDAWRVAAANVLDMALAKTASSKPNEEQTRAMGLVDRIFGLTQYPGQTAAQTKTDIATIKGVFEQIKLLIQAITNGGQYLHESTDPAHATDTAYTFPGHWAKRDPNDGIWYVKSKIETASDEFVIDATMHEFAHFCGPTGANAIDHARVGGKPAYGALALGLSKPDAMRNASSYAWLAYLSRMPSSKWLTAT